MERVRFLSCDDDAQRSSKGATATPFCLLLADGKSNCQF